MSFTASRPRPASSRTWNRYKLIWNLVPDNRFTNLVTEEGNGGFYFSWRDLGETDAHARELIERYQRRPEFEFFDLQADPHEMTNLAEMAEHRERIAAMLEQLQTWMRDQGDLGLQTEIEAAQRQGAP